MYCCRLRLLHVQVVKWLSRRNCALIVFPCKLFASREGTQARRHVTYKGRNKLLRLLLFSNHNCHLLNNAANSAATAFFLRPASTERGFIPAFRLSFHKTSRLFKKATKFNINTIIFTHRCTKINEKTSD